MRELRQSERKILNLVSEQISQSNIAKALSCSRAYVNQTVKKYEGQGLLKRVPTHKTAEGKREYNLFYEVSPQLRAMLGGEPIVSQSTPMRTHFIRLKFKIISQTDKPTKDPRTGFSKSWKMRGAEWCKFWYPGRAGLPSVTLDIMPRTIVGYVDRGQTINAPTKEEADKLGELAIYQAKDNFVKEQARFRILFETEHTGTRIGKAHVGLAFHEGGPLDSEIRIPGMWTDKSVQKELGPGFKEVECHIDHELATPLERAVMAVAGIEKKVDVFEDKIPEMMRGMLDPLNTSVLRVHAMLQGGITISQQYEQMVNFMTKVLDEMVQIRKENAELKARLGG